MEASLDTLGELLRRRRVDEAWEHLTEGAGSGLSAKDLSLAPFAENHLEFFSSIPRLQLTAEQFERQIDHIGSLPLFERVRVSHNRDIQAQWFQLCSLQFYNTSQVEILYRVNKIILDCKRAAEVRRSARREQQSAGLVRSYLEESEEDLGPFPAGEGWTVSVNDKDEFVFANARLRVQSLYDPRVSDFALITSDQFKDTLVGKVGSLRNNLQPYRGYGEVRISAPRAEIQDRMFELLSHPDRMKTNFHVEFEGELGYDASGLTRELFSQLAKTVFSPNYGNLIYASEHDHRLKINSLIGTGYEQKQSFRFIGRVIGFTIFHKQNLKFSFVPYLYKQILGLPVLLEDFRSIDRQLCRNLLAVRNLDAEDLCLCFTIDEEMFGRAEQTELIPDGENIDVTDDNKERYIELYLKHLVSARVEPLIEELRQGIFDFVPENYLRNFSPLELRVLISGTPEIDVQDWKDHTDYDRCNANTQQVKWFWEILFEYDHEKRSQVLQFSTGASQTPVGGFASGGLRRFTLRLDESAVRLPTASSCFNTLTITKAPTKKILGEKLELALSNMDYFGFC